MLNFQKSVSDRIGLGYDFSSPNIASSSTIVFVSPTNNVESENTDVKTVLASENIDKGKSILGDDLLTNEENLARQKPHKVVLRSPLPRIH